MSSHHRSGGPPSLMDDVHDFDRNFHSHRFEGDRGGRGGGMRGRGGGGGGVGDRGGGRGRGGGDRGFVPRGGPRGGHGDFHQRDRFNNNFNRSNDDYRGGGGNPPKMSGLLDPDQEQSRPFDHDNNNRHGGHGRMPYAREGNGSGGGRDSSGDDRYRHSGSKLPPGDGPPPLLDFGNEKSGLPTSASNSSLPSLLSVPLENSGVPPSRSDTDKPNDSHKDYPHSDHSSTRSDHHSSHRDNDNRYRDRDSHRSNREDYHRSSSYNRDRSRSPRDRDRERDRHGGGGGPPRDDRSYGGDYRRGGRGGGDHYGRGGRNDHREPHQSRFGPPDNNPQPWQDRRGGGRGGFGPGGRGGFQDHQREMRGPHRLNEQLPSDNYPYSRDGRPTFDGPPSQNRPFPEGFPRGNFDPMGVPPPQHRPNFNQPPNFNPGPPPNRPDFYPPNAANSPYQQQQQQHTRSGGRPSRFSDRQDDYEDDRPLTKPNFNLLHANTTTAPLYINQPTNPTYTQPRPQMASTFSQQPPLGIFPQGGPPAHQPPGQFSWPNPQGQQPLGGPNAHINPSLAAAEQQNPNLPGHPPTANFYGNINDFHRQQPPSQAANPYFPGVPPVLPQVGAKPPNLTQPNPMAMPSQQIPAAGAAANTAAAAAASASNTEAWQQYYQQYWQYMQQQQQQQQQAGVQPPANPMGAQLAFPQGQAGSATAPKQPTASTSTTGNGQDAAATQASTEAWTQYWIQYQAYMQQQQQQGQAPGAGSAMITAPSQLYPQAAGKPASTPVNSSGSANAPPSSNWQTWFNPKG